MVKYVPEDTGVFFQELPNEVTMTLNISNCPGTCVGCHSPYLRKDVGTELTPEILDNLISKNDGITAVCFMGEGNDPETLQSLILHVRKTHPELKIGLYSGRETVPETFYWDNLDYLKIGPFKPEFGPLNNPNTNQVMKARGRCLHKMSAYPDEWYDITDRFWTKQV